MAGDVSAAAGDDSKPARCNGWAFVFAMEREAAPFRKLCPEAMVFVTGIGRANAMAATLRIIDERRPRLIVSAGFAGALRPAFAVGDVLCMTQTIDSARSFDALPCEVIATNLRIGRLLTVDTMIGDPAEKASLAKLYDVDAIDMESAAIARICRDRGVKFACIRVISDDTATPLPAELSQLLSSGEVSMFIAMKVLARHPWLLPSFFKLAQATRIASQRLGEAIAMLQ